MDAKASLVGSDRRLWCPKFRKEMGEGRGAIKSGLSKRESAKVNGGSYWERKK